MFSDKQKTKALDQKVKELSHLEIFKAATYQLRELQETG